MPDSDIDPIELEVVKASLGGIVQEMQNALFRTGFSTIVRESQDASCALMNARADVVAQHVVLPLHIGAFPACCAAILREFADDIAEGDAFLINHPYHGGSPHAPDIAVITPDVRRRRAVRLLRQHRPQERHRRAGARQLLRPGARDLQRGPAAARGALPARDSSRSATSSASSPPTAARPSWCSATSAASSAPTGSASAASPSSIAKLRPAQDRRRLRPPAAALGGAGCAPRSPNGRTGATRRSASSTTTASTLDKPVRVHVVVEKEGDAIRFDFSGSADQTAGPANIRPPLVQAACAYCLISHDRPAHLREQRPAACLRHRGARGQRAQSALSGAGQHLQPDRPRGGRRGLRGAEPHRAGQGARGRQRQPLDHPRRAQHLHAARATCSTRSSAAAPARAP